MATVCFILLLLLLNVIFEHLDKDNNKLWHGDPVKLIFSKKHCFFKEVFLSVKTAIPARKLQNYLSAVLFKHSIV